MPQVDFLIIGSGVAGLSYALRVARHGSVAVITKKDTAESNTNYAQGGIAAVMDSHDSYESHVRDTLEAGRGLCDADVVRFVVEEGPQRIHELMRMGVEFTHRHGQLHLGREGGHSAERIVHVDDMTGREVEQALLTSVRSDPGIEVYEYHFAVELITEHHLGQHVSRLRPDVHCFGAYVYDSRADRVETFLARSILLASGGSGAVYLHTTNPSVATGDGVAMAYRAKARICNMEFVQFHPTSLYHPEGDSFLISEALRGEGGRLYNLGGERFMPSYDAREELAPRDIVARAIDDQLKQRGESHVWLDISHCPADVVRERFPNIHGQCLRFGIDITQQPIPVVPAAHYQCGGVFADHWGRTSIAGLFACGEVASTGMHGANRLASNSMLEALVFSRRAAEGAIEHVAEQSFRDDVPEWDSSGTERPHEWVLVSHNRDELTRVMWDYVGIVRSVLRLERALRRMRFLYEETEDFYRRTCVSVELGELRNMITVAWLIIRSARMRRESRGLHYMLDYPKPVEDEKRPTLI